jgi:hypothetical protein
VSWLIGRRIEFFWSEVATGFRAAVTAESARRSSEMEDCLRDKSLAGCSVGQTEIVRVDSAKA